MKKPLCLLFIALGLGACGGGAGGESAASYTLVPPLALEPPPVYSLLGYRDRINLTSEQITRLDSIAIALREENAPLVAELRENARLQSRSGGGLQVQAAQRPLLDQIRENSTEAIEAVGELLTEDQEEEICKIYEDERVDRTDRQRRSERRSRRRRARGMPADSLVFRGFRGWPWCGEGDDADAEEELTLSSVKGTRLELQGAPPGVSLGS